MERDEKAKVRRKTLKKQENGLSDEKKRSLKDLFLNSPQKKGLNRKGERGV